MYLSDFISNLNNSLGTSPGKSFHFVFLDREFWYQCQEILALFFLRKVRQAV